MYLFQSCFNLIVTSNSGQAALTMPIMAPLADLVGVSRQVAVLAFQLGAGFVDAFTPVSASLIGVLGVARIDWGKWARALPVRADFTLGGMKFSMIHNRRDLPSDPGDRQIIIFGHSHQYTEEVREGRLWITPGSCGPRRFSQEITMAVLIVEKGSWQAVRMELSCE